MTRQKLVRITTVPISFFSLLRGQLRFMNQFYDVLAVSSKGNLQRDVEENEGVPVITVEMTRRISPIKDLKAVWLLYLLFRREKPFIVHSHTPKAGTVGMIAARLAGVPNRLHTVAGLPLLEVSGAKRLLLNFVEKLTYACATRIYPNSKGLHDIILKSKFTTLGKLKVIGTGSSNGINTKHFDPRLFSGVSIQRLKDDLNIEADDFVYIFVGRLVNDKGITELLESFQVLSSTMTSVKLLLVGFQESELDPLSDASLAILNSNNAIISVGFQKDVRPYFAISDALVFPSYREGFPNVVMQAGAMGIPAIVSNINGCNEIIADGVNGIVVPVKDTNALRLAMFQLFDDRQLRKKLTSNARRMIVERYEQRFVWDAILAEYKSLQRDV